MKLANAAFLFLITGQFTLCQGSRERIGEYVATGQQFLVVDPDVDETIILYEDPDAKPVPLTRVYWFCPSKHAPDRNEDGQYDNVVSHALTFRPEGEFNDIIAEGASVSGSWTPHGYVAAWGKGGTYDEFLVDYDDRTMHKFIETEANSASIAGWELSDAGDTSGLVISGVGEWISDTTDARLVKLSEALGAELTGENCNAKYAEVWKAANPKKSKTSAGAATCDLQTASYWVKTKEITKDNFMWEAPLYDENNNAVGSWFQNEFDMGDGCYGTAQLSLDDTVSVMALAFNCATDHNPIMGGSGDWKCATGQAVFKSTGNKYKLHVEWCSACDDE